MNVNIINNELVRESFNKIKNNYSIEEANYILLNSLAILGDKKVVVERVKELDKKALERINRYKYPERLASFLGITQKKSESWSNLSFAKLALS